MTIEFTGRLLGYSGTKSPYALVITCRSIYRSNLWWSRQIKGSFAQTHCFDRAIAYLESGKVKVKGMVRVFLIQILDYGLNYT